MSKTKDPKTELTDAVNRAAKSLAGVLRVFEREGAAFEQVDVQKTFAHLRASLTVLERKATLARDVAALTDRPFDLDAAPATSVSDDGHTYRLAGQSRPAKPKTEPDNFNDVDFLDPDEE